MIQYTFTQADSLTDNMSTLFLILYLPFQMENTNTSQIKKL